MTSTTTAITATQNHEFIFHVIIFVFAASVVISGDADGFIALTSALTGMTLRVINDHKGAPMDNFDIASVSYNTIVATANVCV